MICFFQYILFLISYSYDRWPALFVIVIFPNKFFAIIVVLEDYIFMQNRSTTLTMQSEQLVQFAYDKRI